MSDASAGHRYDHVFRDCLIYDGSGAPPSAGEVALRGDCIGAVGNRQ